MSSLLNREGVEEVGEMIDRVRQAGLTREADVFSKSYWAWLRLTEAYVNAHPYVRNPESPSMTPISALSVVDFTFSHWAELVPGSPRIDDEAVLEAARRDEAWHREEDRRMRRAAGEFGD